MKFEHLIQRLHASKPYEEFAKKHKKAFLVAGFFVMDLESKNHIYQIDYYVPSENKIAAFSLGSPISMQMLEMVKSDTKPVELLPQADIDLDSLKGILGDEMKNRSITEGINKIVAILHNHEGKTIWNLSCMLSGMSLLKAHIEDKTKSVLKMERSSLMDIMKQVPGKKSLNSQVQNPAPTKNSAISSAGPVAKPSKEQVKQALTEEIKKLDTIEVQIEREKAKLKLELEKGPKSLPKTDKKVNKK